MCDVLTCASSHYHIYFERYDRGELLSIESDWYLVIAYQNINAKTVLQWYQKRMADHL
jgi:hypothetical protein